ncbi:MAG: acetate--CoA ligase family protein [Desulfobacterales bacterium]
MKIQTDKTSIDAIFKPRSIAVIGASDAPGKWGYRMTYRPFHSGFTGKIYPINPAKSEILGLKAYQTVSDVPEQIDLAVITTPAASVPGILKECSDKAVKGAVVITAGFAEVGDEGRRLEKQISEVAQSGGIRFVGPNCMGIWSAAANLNLSFGRPPEKGPIAFISQSGTFGVSMAQEATARGYGLNKFISIGNQADLEVADYLEYLAEDDDTRVIALYLEGLKDGGRFFSAAKKTVVKKPIVVYKAGRSGAAERAAISHTASVAGSAVVFENICRQLGLLQVNEAFHLFETAQALAGLAPAGGNRVAILGSGGQGVVGTDACAGLGMELPELDSETSASISALLPDHAPRAKNPVDFAGSIRTAMQEAEIIERLLQLDYIDGVISNVPVSPQLWDPGLRIDRTAEDLPPAVQTAIKGGERYAALAGKYEKPVICLRFAQLENDVMEEILNEGGIPVYSTPEQCARAMHALVHYGRIRKKVQKNNSC